MKNVATNMKVETPLGNGVVDGMFLVLDGHGKEISRGIGVRLPVNEATKPHLNKSNCITPMARVNGLWVFDAEVLK